MKERTHLNLGCVVYTQTSDGIIAEWIYSRNGKIESGTGIGIRASDGHLAKGIEGLYEITYFDQKGNPSPNLLLTISANSDHYNLSWSHNGKTTDLGIGILKDNKLLASYTEML